MFYYNGLVKKRVHNYKITFTAFASGANTQIDDGILPYKLAKKCYNYQISSGALQDGIGFEPLSLPKSYNDITDERVIRMEQNQEIKQMWLYKFYDQQNQRQDYKLLFYTTDGVINWVSLYSNSTYTNYIASLIYSAGVPNAINYRLDGDDYMIFSSATDGMWKYNANYMAQRIENGPSLASMCVHYERLFAVLENGERNRLSFSQDLDPTNFNVSLTEGGFIDMQDERGKLNKVVSFNDYVYVFRDFGVSRISAYGDQATFSVSQLFVSSSKIYSNSVCVCGDRIMLLCRDGLHYFDGYKTTKLSLGIENLLDGVVNENCSSTFYNGKYYLALRLNWNDDEKVGCENYAQGYTNNAVLVYDIKTGDITLTRGVDICSILAIDDGNFGKVIACFNGEYKNVIGQMTNDGKFFGQPLKKCWTTPKSNLGYPTLVKRVKEVFVKTKSPCKVKISTEKLSKTYQIKGSEKTQRIKTNVYGEQVEVSFISQDNSPTLISCPQIIIGVTS